MKELLPEPWTNTNVGDDEWLESERMKNSPFRAKAWRTCLRCGNGVRLRAYPCGARLAPQHLSAGSPQIALVADRPAGSRFSCYEDG
ncbi:hypothetical protein ACFYUV_29540 [Nonomuraea sp. NPDC003560]|uniref:hypothetical protein n=1 Tax=Nonomuraea sp. NPDC003560 TaxID=3364341 RepID=UPI003680EDA5